MTNIMKLIYFIIIVAIVYYLAITIRVVHIDTLPDDQQTELENRSRVRSMLISNTLKEAPVEHMTQTIASPTPAELYQERVDRYAGSQLNSHDYKRDYYDLEDIGNQGLPTHHNIVDLIKSEYRDEQYLFNVPNLPSTSRYPSDDSVNEDRMYLKQIKKEIQNWNNLFDKYYSLNKNLITAQEIKLIYVHETPAEFVVKANVAIAYLQKTQYLQVTYYGQITHTDDILTSKNQIQMQLLDIKRINKHLFLSQYNEKITPFIGMQDQLAYVNKIIAMHKLEDE